MEEDLLIRLAKPKDFKPCNELIYSTGDYFFDYLFPYNKEEIIELLGILFQKTRGIFSYKFAWVCELRGKVVGIVLGYDAREKKYHDIFNTLYIIKRHNPFQLIRMIYRDFHIKRFLHRLDPGSYYIANLAVMPDIQGKGLGKILLDYAFSEIKNKGFKKCYLDVSVKNKNAIKLYEANGFTIYKEIRNEKLEKKCNLHGQLRMIKNL